MSVTFSGRNETSFIDLHYPEPDEYGDDERIFNLANGNACAFLRLLQVPNIDESDLCGKMPIADMMRLISKARASFDYRVDVLVRSGIDAKGKRGPRIIAMGIDEDYFQRRLAEFAEYVTDLSLAGATYITWG